MTPQEIIHAAQRLSFKDLVYLVSQLVQLLEAQLAKPETRTIQTPKSITTSHKSSTAAVGIIADLINNPIAFDGVPLTRDEIYER
ncbi:MAG: hypothetical protein AAGA46_09015 [Cyanobacteria bacterium P01_F01_bin.13]